MGEKLTAKSFSGFQLDLSRCRDPAETAEVTFRAASSAAELRPKMEYGPMQHGGSVAG